MLELDLLIIVKIIFAQKVMQILFINLRNAMVHSYNLLSDKNYRFVVYYDENHSNFIDVIPIANSRVNGYSVNYFRSMKDLLFQLRNTIRIYRLNYKKLRVVSKSLILFKNLKVLLIEKVR